MTRKQGLGNLEGLALLRHVAGYVPGVKPLYAAAALGVCVNEWTDDPAAVVDGFSDTVTRWAEPDVDSPRHP